MSVKISVFGADEKSDEYNSACKLKKILRESLPNAAEGEIVLYSSATLYGQAVKDIDILMLGSLTGCSISAAFNKNRDSGTDKITANVDITTFATVIEIKRHDISGISVRGTDIYVKYSGGLHSVTLQSNQQKLSAKSFFETVLKSSPYITNIIWFTQAAPGEIRGLLKSDDGKIPSNVLGSEFTFTDLARLLVMQKPPYKDGNKYIFDSNYKECTLGDFQKALKLFSDRKEQMGELTRKKLERISNKSLKSSELTDSQGKILIYRGRAGTGKTIGLIQRAIRLVDEKHMRVLILTYNKALVLDIRRLFALAELPDMFEERCVEVSTMSAYFMHLADAVLYEGKLSFDEYIKNTESILKDMNDLMSDESGVSMVREMISGNQALVWDYLMIDEAQDWSPLERDLVLKLFNKGRIIIANGGEQFVRRLDACDWTVVQEKNDIDLKYCLRQKENLIAFLNAYTEKSDISGKPIEGKGELLGGKVIITTDDRIIDIHRQEMETLKKSGNIAYDMLYLVPHALVTGEKDNKHFARKDEFESAGIKGWDGTRRENRDVYSVDNDEVRFLQYDSSRGLEGWTVVCMDFDVFLEEKANEYKKDNKESLLLESLEDKKRKFLYNWAMIPLTRAIDTLIITLKDPESEVGKMLRDITKRCEDYASWYIKGEVI